MIIKRQRIKQSKPLKDRLLEQAQRLREEAEILPNGPLREAAMRRARQVGEAANLDDWLSSSGLRPPKKPNNPGPR